LPSNEECTSKLQRQASQKPKIQISCKKQQQTKPTQFFNKIHHMVDVHTKNNEMCNNAIMSPCLIIYI
jgi:hypothetical protein